MGTDVVTFTAIIQISLTRARADFWVSPDKASRALMNNSDPAGTGAALSGIMAPNGHSFCPVQSFELCPIRGSPRQCHLGHSLL